MLSYKLKLQNIYIFGVKLIESLFIVVSGHLIELQDYLSNIIRIIRHSLMLLPLKASLKASQQIMQRIRIVMLIKFN